MIRRSILAAAPKAGFVMLLAFALILTACGSEGQSSSAGDDALDGSAASEESTNGGAELSGELSFMVAEYSTATKPFWEEQIAAFEDEHPDVSINLQVVGWQEMHDVTAQRIAANDLPDMVNTATIWLPEWVESGAIRTVGDDIVPSEVLSDFIPAVMERGAEYEGQNWGLPIAGAARAMFYNEELLSQAGIESPPATWDELREATLAVSEATGEFGYAFDAKGVQAFRYFGVFLWNNGGDFFDDDGKAAFNSPAGVEALDFLVDLAQTDAVPDPTGTALEDFQPLFQNGRLAMMIDGNFFVAALEDNAPELGYGVAPVPVSGADTDPVTWGVTDTLVFNSDAPAELTKAFVGHIYQADVRTTFDTNEGLLPVLGSQSDDSDFSDPNSQAWIEMLGNARFDPLHPNYSQMQELLKTAMQEAIKGGKSAQEALDDAADSFNNLIDR
jgi:multiple sugar transport system substrate-binding protein